jgi:hypothetical protein
MQSRKSEDADRNATRLLDGRLAKGPPAELVIPPSTARTPLCKHQFVKPERKLGRGAGLSQREVNSFGLSSFVTHFNLHTIKTLSPYNSAWPSSDGGRPDPPTPILGTARQRFGGNEHADEDDDGDMHNSPPPCAVHENGTMDGWTPSFHG